MRPTQRFGELLDDLSTREGRLVSYTMYILNVIFIGFYIFGTYSISEPFATELLIAETLLALVFLFEYVSRLDFADNTWEEAKNPYSIADILAVLPALLVFFFPILGQVAFFRSLQVFRIFRFIRVGLEDNRFFNYELSGKQVVVAEVLTAIILLVMVHAGLIYAFEHTVNPGFPNFGVAFYYSIVALTTTGFGNVVPVTALGQMVTGVGLICAVTVIPWLVIRPRETRSADTRECPKCNDSNHHPEAVYCHKCSERLPDPEDD